MPKIDTKDPRLTFAQIKITVDTTEIFAKSISYGDSMDFADVEGNQQMSAGTTAGVYKADEASIELYLEEYAALLDAFKDNFYRTTFKVTVAYEYQLAGITGGKMKADELVACRWTKRAANDQSGADGLTRSLSFKPLYIKAGGHNPLPGAAMPQGAQ
ncbi:hypothetical protein ACFP81_10680 [Deinococcus lacus]|uniref:Uncharacterized protein n=1 Tax=Deinococcus lacus TaxID=392561 RepID=A0ABW1YEG4_9DEIO